MTSSLTSRVVRQNVNIYNRTSNVFDSINRAKSLKTKMASSDNEEKTQSSSGPELLMEEDLLSFETLDRSSPDLWPQQISGIVEFKSDSSDSTVPPWKQGLSSEDLSLLHHYGSLTLSALIVEVRKLYEKAYQLGIDESKQMTRGKYLNILNRRRPPN